MLKLLDIDCKLGRRITINGIATFAAATASQSDKTSACNSVFMFEVSGGFGYEFGLLKRIARFECFGRTHTAIFANWYQVC